MTAVGDGAVSGSEHPPAEPPKPDQSVSGLRRFVLPAAEYGAWVLAFPTGPLVARSLGARARGELVVITLVQFFTYVVPAVGVAVTVKRRVALGSNPSIVITGIRVAMPWVLGWITVLTLAGSMLPLSPNLQTGLLATAAATPLLVWSTIIHGALVGAGRIYSLALVRIIPLAVFAATVSLLFVTGSLTFGWMVFLNLLPLSGDIAFGHVFVGHWRRQAEPPPLSHEDRRFGYASLGAQVSESTLMRGDSIMATVLMSARDLGIYSVAANLAQFVNAGCYAVGVTHFRRLAAAPADESLASATRKVAREAATLVVLIGSAVAAVGWYAIPLVYGGEYRPAYLFFLYLLPGVPFLSYAVVVWNTLVAHGHPGTVVRAQVASTIAAVVLAAGLFLLVGPDAVPIAYSLAMVVLAGLLSRSIKRLTSG